MIVVSSREVGLMYKCVYCNIILLHHRTSKSSQHENQILSQCYLACVTIFTWLCVKEENYFIVLGVFC